MQQFTIVMYNEAERMIGFRVTSWASGVELKVHTKEGEGSEFVILFPA